MDGTKILKGTVFVNPELLRRVESAAENAQISPEILVEEAIEHELRRLELERVREEIAELEIQRNILASGQIYQEPMEKEPGAPGVPVILRCELCLVDLPSSIPNVIGPLFCSDCLEIAKGANLQMMEQEA